MATIAMTTTSAMTCVNIDSKDDNNYKHSDDDNDADVYQLAMMILKLIL